MEIYSNKDKTWLEIGNVSLLPMQFFPNAKDSYSVLDTLAEYGYVAYENVTAANNRPAQMVYVNPHI